MLRAVDSGEVWYFVGLHFLDVFVEPMKPEDLLLAAELSAGKIEQFLKRYGFKDPETADRNLQLMAEDLPLRHILARMTRRLLEAAGQSPDPDAALNHFERLFSNLAHRANFLGFLGEAPEALEALILICGASPFNAEILIRNPEYFYWLLDQLGSPWVKSPPVYLQEARQTIGKFDDGTLQLRALARFKRREMLRIGARDLLKVTNVEGTIAELSNLADAVIQCVFDVCLRELVARYGVPQNPGAPGGPRDARFAILAMGKLGGHELNYSSDIDVIYIYDGEEGSTQASTPSQTSIPNHEFFIRLAQSLTHELSTLTEEGYFYRVDLRLRPEGSAGPIASSLSACRNYYGTWGETFERLALIKARPVGGSMDLGLEFCEAFRPFVYRKFLDFAALEEIQEIKGRIEAKLSTRKGRGHHVKLGAGGIREVEFFVQALQLIYGGRQTELQEAGTLLALGRLLQFGYLPPGEHDALREAYLFLRDVEHKLQMVYHLQTHELPTDPTELYKCARRMGYRASTEAATVELFLAEFHQHRSAVERSFQNLIALKRTGPAGEQMREASLILNRNLIEADALEIISRPGFEDPRTALHQVVLLRDAPSFAHSPSKMRNLLANLLPPLLDALQLSPDPDTGLSYFERFASTLGARDALYALLNESPSALQRLVRLLSCSQFLADFLCRKPEFLDFLLRDDFLENVKSRDEYFAVVQNELRKDDNIEVQVSAVREIQQAELFRIQARDIFEGNDRPAVGAQLAGLAEVCLIAAFQIACRQLENEGDAGLSDWAEEHLAVMALGKLGGGDLSYNSDLDLVYFYSVGTDEQASNVQARASRVVDRIDEILNVSRGEGAIYKIDTRLRPEGKKGGVVAAIHRYEEYLHRRAEFWERIALVRHRFVLGSPQNLAKLGNMLTTFLYCQPLGQQEVEGIIRIRQRMEAELGKESDGQFFHIKAGRGGLTDIEFAVQLLQLRYGGQYPELRVPNTMSALANLAARGLVTRNDFLILSIAYEFLRFVENRLRIASPYGTALVARDPRALGRIGRLLGYSSTNDPQAARNFESAYLDTTGKVRKIFQRLLSSL
jgi:[glutamine synthetase] adenylyltransferase / [glutamine synthetase]-adenylyl-L-tyrosine phosphorylase